jgi:hypothetical protein
LKELSLEDKPSQIADDYIPHDDEVDKTYDKIFGDIDGEEGFEKALLMVQALRGSS